MSSLAEGDTRAVGEGAAHVPAVAVLEIPRDFLFAHFFVLDAPVDLGADCPHCGERRLFRGERECVWGLIAKCTECGEEKIVGTNSEAA